MASSKRILIRVDGSHSIGLGHVYRMRTLAENLSEKKYTVHFLTRPYTSGADILGQSGFELLYQIDKTALVETAVLEEYQPDLIVLDILSTPANQLTDLRERTTARVLSFDDTGAGLQQSDGVINALVFCWGQYEPDNCRAKLYEGPDYLIIRPLPTERWQPKRDIGGMMKVFLAFGGTDDHRVSGRMIAALNDLASPLHVTVNLGPAAQADTVLQAAAKTSPHRVEVLHATPDLWQQMLFADLVICGGGIMLYEAAALGVPSAGIATERHEIGNLEFAAKCGFTANLGWESTLDFPEAANNIYRLLKDSNALALMADRALKTVDGQGLDRCVDIAGDLLANAAE